MTHHRNPDDKKEAFYDRLYYIEAWLTHGLTLSESDMRFCSRNRFARQCLREHGCLHILEMQEQ